MTTLTTSLNYNSSSPAIIIPESNLQLSYSDLKHHIHSLQSTLAEIGVAPHSAVSISLINSLEFAISFLAVGAQRAIAAPLNPSYQQSEVEFYVDDIKAALIIVPRGAVEKGAPAVKAARKFNAGIAEIWWDGSNIKLALKEKGKHLKSKQDLVKAQSDDIAVTSVCQEVTNCSSFFIRVERPVVRKVTTSQFFHSCSCASNSSELDPDNEEYNPNLQTNTIRSILSCHAPIPRPRSISRLPLPSPFRRNSHHPTEIQRNNLLARIHKIQSNMVHSR